MLRCLLYEKPGCKVKRHVRSFSMGPDEIWLIPHTQNIAELAVVPQTSCDIYETIVHMGNVL